MAHEHLDPRTSTEIIKDRLYFCALTRLPAESSSAHFFCIDDTLRYEPFFSDFGPLNLNLTYKFCQMLIAKLNAPEHAKKQIYFYCFNRPQNRANAAVLIGIYLMVYAGRSSAQAYEPLKALEPYLPFRDASQGLCTFRLLPQHCLRAIGKALKLGWLNFDSWNSAEYEHFESVENGDLNIICPKKFLAFSGPHATNVSPDGYPTLTPADYVPIFKMYGVSTVVRLNKKCYERKDFLNAGVDHHDLYFIDGTTPSQAILDRFLAVCEAASGMVAVHCKAGLGRTGSTIGCYLMKHYHFSAAETIAWLRLCRPGMVIACLAFGTQVATPSSSRSVAIEEVKPGDQLVGSAGEPIRVLSSTFGESATMLRLTYSRGQHVVTPNHLVTLRCGRNPTVTSRKETDSETCRLRISYYDRDCRMRSIHFRYRPTGELPLEEALPASAQPDLSLPLLPTTVSSHAHDFALWFLEQRERASLITVLRLGDLVDITAEKVAALALAKSFRRDFTLPIVRTEEDNSATEDGYTDDGEDVPLAPEDDAAAEEMMTKSPPPAAIASADFASLVAQFVDEMGAGAGAAAASVASGDVASDVLDASAAQPHASVLVDAEEMTMARAVCAQHSQLVTRASDGSIALTPAGTLAEISDVAVVYMVSGVDRALTRRQLERSWQTWSLDTAASNIMVTELNPTESNDPASDSTCERTLSGVLALKPKVIIGFGRLVRDRWLQAAAHLKAANRIESVKHIYDVDKINQRRMELRLHTGETVNVLLAANPGKMHSFASVLEAVADAHDVAYERGQIVKLVRNSHVRLIDITPAAGARFVALEVDSADKRFALADRILTHNCQQHWLKLQEPRMWKLGKMLGTPASTGAATGAGAAAAASNSSSSTNSPSPANAAAASSSSSSASVSRSASHPDPVPNYSISQPTSPLSPNSPTNSSGQSYSASFDTPPTMHQQKINGGHHHAHHHHGHHGGSHMHGHHAANGHGAAAASSSAASASPSHPQTRSVTSAAAQALQAINSRSSSSSSGGLSHNASPVHTRGRSKISKDLAGAGSSMDDHSPLSQSTPQPLRAQSGSRLSPQQRLSPLSATSGPRNLFDAKPSPGSVVRRAPSATGLRRGPSSPASASATSPNGSSSSFAASLSTSPLAASSAASSSSSPTAAATLKSKPRSNSQTPSIGFRQSKGASSATPAKKL